MTDFTLRPYQEAAINGVQAEFKRGRKQVMLSMPTGAGKTLTASEMLGRSHAKGKTMLWLTDREELADQASDAFDRVGIPHSYIMAGESADRLGRAFVGTIQSFLAWRRKDATGESRKWTPEKVDFIVIDEAHRTQSRSFQLMLAEYPDAFVLGLSATPMRGDGQGLGKTYRSLVVPVTMRELLDEGVLVTPRYFVPPQAEYTKLQRIKTGDFSSAELSAWAEANPQLVGDAVENFARICPSDRFLAFPPDIKTSLALRDRMNAAGFSCIHIDGNTPKPERRRLMQAFRDGEYQGMTSVNIAIEGLDVPDVVTAINMRPTKSERIWVQMVGRVLRSAPGKTFGRILDHAGGLAMFGPAEDFVPPELHSKEGKKSEGSKSRKKPKDEKKQFPCEGLLPTGDACCAVLIGTHVCPECGHEHHFEQAPDHASFIPGELEELTAEGQQQHAYDLNERKRWYAEFLGYCQNRGKSPGAAYYLYLEKFKEKPPYAWREFNPKAPSSEVLAYCKSRAIAYAKGMQKRQSRAA
ncbi:DEAD/DEAH box helicase [Deinococcus wulumuqiensis]|uniref:DEAD/DEAH box helicase n=1 Tax=Deinococcus wulumuqiensis TaxID=980427 RepID=A0AAV4K5F4_9DEIO|nr:DEAD/DEAH box helicase [Deinococcus wulumuqiensis]QII20011.1 DEAD/DEAH box helicase [Deinococcus wulumuqiensis R12]GGI86942.1 hypothetical protein GCM10010914_21730 [Deinococcus wulumuqiensis]GGP29946.1 hypothetical protein GCM10008021_15970 [Deinococcus wulumuqiensis]